MSHEMPEAVVVVGDRFEEFLAQRGTVAATDLLARLRTRDLPGRLEITVGQGLSADQLSELSVLAEMSAGTVHIRQGEVPAPVDRRLTHKHDAKNVLIGPVQEAGEGTYRAPLLLDQRVEVLADHLTGLHIPAVTLLEAARQTWTVVTEPVPARRRAADPVRDQLGELLLPPVRLPAAGDVEYRLRGRTASPVGQSIAFTVQIHQGGEVAAVFEAEIRVVPQRFAEKQEVMAARTAVRRQLAAPAAAGREPALAGAGGGERRCCGPSTALTAPVRRSAGAHCAPSTPPAWAARRTARCCTGRSSTTTGRPPPEACS